MGTVEIILIAAAVVYVIGGRLAGQPLQARRLVLLPAALTIYGFTQLSHLDAIGIAALVVEGLMGLGLGAVRGVTIAVYERAGHLWFRYRPVTIAVWVLTIGLRVTIAWGAQRAGASLPGAASILTSFGLSLFGEAAILARKAQRLGVPYAPDRRTARAMR